MSETSNINIVATLKHGKILSKNQVILSWFLFAFLIVAVAVIISVLIFWGVSDRAQDNEKSVIGSAVTAANILRHKRFVRRFTAS